MGGGEGAVRVAVVMCEARKLQNSPPTKPTQARLIPSMKELEWIVLRRFWKIQKMGNREKTGLPQSHLREQ